MDTYSVEQFIFEYRSARIEEERRTLILLNDRGFKVKYLQDYKFSVPELSKIDEKYRSSRSLYINWCLYRAYASTYMAERLLARGIFSGRDNLLSCNSVLNNENECYGAIMSCLSLLDVFLLRKECSTIPYDQKNIPSAVKYLLNLCLLLIALYLEKFFGIDKMRTAECYVNRARLNDRFYYYHLDSLLFCFSTLSTGKYEPLINPTDLKSLYIYDMHEAGSIMPAEFDENYDYRMSANMMHQNRQVAKVLPEGGDVFETNYFDMHEIGKQYSDAMSNLAEYLLPGVWDAYCDFHDQLISFLNKSYINDQIRFCVSYSHQVEPYSTYGKVIVTFKPLLISIDTAIKVILNAAENKDVKIKSNKNKVLLEDLKLYPNYSLQEGKTECDWPKIYSILLYSQDCEHVSAINCYGVSLRPLKHYIDWHHLFCGIPVSVMHMEDYAFPETMTLKVVCQHENDITIM